MTHKPNRMEVASPQNPALNSKYSPGWGMLLLIIGRFLSYLGIAVIFWSIVAVVKSGGVVIGFAVGAIAGLIAFGGAYLARKGRQYRAQSAEMLMSNDKRPPVLYMRSFKDDELLADDQGASLPTAGMPLRSEEQLLVKVLQTIGPVIAIGKPGETLPQLGAARMYVQDDDWQDKIAELMPEAKLVVLLAGFTVGLLWELETAITRVNPKHLVILLPYDSEQYDAFCEKTQSLFGHQMPEYNAPTKATVTKIRGIIAFDGNWKPEFIGVYARRLRLFNGPFRRKMVLQEGFRPIFDQINLT